MDPLWNPNLLDGPIMKSRFKGWNHYGNPFSGYGLTMKPQNGASSGTHNCHYLIGQSDKMIEKLVNGHKIQSKVIDIFREKFET